VSRWSLLSPSRPRVQGPLAPLNTPQEIIARLNAEIIKALAVPDVKERLVAIGFEIDGSSPQKLAAITKARLEQMQNIIKDAGITIQ
jgi:tripartite-type tricarboxylate transporter receptor subunit TctC